MRVLLISPKLEKANGGIAVWTNLYLGKCKANCIECDLVNTAEIGRRLVDGNARRELFSEIVRTRRIFRDLGKCLKNASYDIVHLNTSCGTFGIFRDMLIARRIKKTDVNCPIIVHYHCDIPFQIKNRMGMWCLKRLIARCDKHFVLCRNSGRFLKENFQADSVIVPNLIDVQNIVQEPKMISKSVERVFFSGNISLEKGAAEIYELARRFPNICFQLAGVADQNVIQWDQPPNLILLGRLPHDEILEKLDEVDLFLFPSYSEGFSMSLVESMARGVPAVATDVGANMDMLENKGGCIVPVGDIDTMQYAMESMFSANVRGEMSRWCVEKVRNEYSSDRVMELFCREYRESGR